MMQKITPGCDDPAYMPESLPELEPVISTEAQQSGEELHSPAARHSSTRRPTP
jgi:hypothetical protein